MNPGAAAVLRSRLRQPDRRSCGATSVVLASMLLDPSYDARVRAAGPLAERFRGEVLGAHARLTRPLDVAGRPQLPWPRALGTPPWAAARWLGTAGSPSQPARRYRVGWARVARAGGFAALLGAVRGGRPALLYVGDRWLPRHVVLALGEESGGVRCYEPSAGRVVVVRSEAFERQRLGLAGWDLPWFVVVPRAGSLSRARR
jgi:hypothetical protein